MVNYIQRDELKRQITTEIIIRKNFIKALTIMRDNFPENGKRFDKRNFDTFNELMNDKNYRIDKYDEYGVKVWYIGSEISPNNTITFKPDYSTTLSYGGILKYNFWFSNNKVENHDAFVKKMDDFIKFQQDKINSLETISDEMISDFQKQWAKFEKLYKDLRDFPLYGYIDVPYVSNCPIYDKHL